MSEQWRPVVGHQRYEVSSQGRVRNASTGHMLSLLAHSGGYRKVHLGRAAYVYVHRIVCEAWHGPAPTTGPHHADHIDFDPENNTPANLRWLPKHLNDFRWKDYAEVVDPDDYVPMKAHESDALDRQMEAAGW